MYVKRQDLMNVLTGALEEELADKTAKERIAIAEVILEALDGPVLAVVDEDEDEVDGNEESYEME